MTNFERFIKAAVVADIARPRPRTPPGQRSSSWLTKACNMRRGARRLV